MNLKSSAWKYGAFALMLGFSLPALAEDEEIPSDVGSLPSSSNLRDNKDDGDGELPPPVLPKEKRYSAAEKKKECAKYEGQYITYYEHIYKVEKCKRREMILREGLEPKLKGISLKNVESDTVAMIPEGLALNAELTAKKRTCAQLEGQYLISRGDDLYIVEKCKKRLFPDLDTYSEHSRKRGKREKDVIEMGEVEISQVADGLPITSSLDAEYKKLLDADEGVDVIPLAEACKGLNGKFVAYYSKLYRIEKCRKQPVDPQLFGKRFPRYTPDELTSEQWMSIPTGKDYKM